MESVLMVGSGQTVVLGGLMQDEARRARQQIPGADSLAAAGELLRFRDEQVGKSELMVFLRPIVIANPSLESDELRFYQRFLPKPEASPPPAENASSAR
jgi:general secretion pathway protein D